MARVLEIRRHAEDDGDDVLTVDGVASARRLGHELSGGYAVVATSGAQRATQTAACLLAGLGEAVPGGVVVEPALRSQREDEWRAAYGEAGSGHLAALREVAPDLVREDADALALGLRRVLEALGDGQRALVIGHSPTNEAAVLGLTGQVVEPLGKLDGVLVEVLDDGTARVAGDA